jgi:hypothetical protein
LTVYYTRIAVKNLRYKELLMKKIAWLFVGLALFVMGCTIVETPSGSEKTPELEPVLSEGMASVRILLPEESGARKTFDLDDAKAKINYYAVYIRKKVDTPLASYFYYSGETVPDDNLANGLWVKNVAIGTYDFIVMAGRKETEYDLPLLIASGFARGVPIEQGIDNNVGITLYTVDVGFEVSEPVKTVFQFPVEVRVNTKNPLIDASSFEDAVFSYINVATEPVKTVTSVSIPDPEYPNIYSFLSAGNIPDMPNLSDKAPCIVSVTGRLYPFDHNTPAFDAWYWANNDYLSGYYTKTVSVVDVGYNFYWDLECATIGRIDLAWENADDPSVTAVKNMVNYYGAYIRSNIAAAPLTSYIYYSGQSSDSNLRVYNIRPGTYDIIVMAGRKEASYDAPVLLASGLLKDVYIRNDYWAPQGDWNYNIDNKWEPFVYTKLAVTLSTIDVEVRSPDEWSTGSPFDTSVWVNTKNPLISTTSFVDAVFRMTNAASEPVKTVTSVSNSNDNSYEFKTSGNMADEAGVPCIVSLTGRLYPFGRKASNFSAWYWANNDYFPDKYKKSTGIH